MHGYIEEEQVSPVEILRAYVSFIRAYHIWMHGAHNVTKGSNFAGDHVELYGKIYSEVQDSVDMILEKGIGVFGDESVACPMSIVEGASVILTDWESPANQSGDSIARLACDYTKKLVAIGEGTASVLDEIGVLTPGMDNMLAGLLDVHEGYVYLLQQRTK